MVHAEGQGGVSAAWKQHRKHVFILSNAGKPIWTLHGDENALAGLMAVIQALVSFVHDKGDSIRSIRYGKQELCGRHVASECAGLTALELV